MNHSHVRDTNSTSVRNETTQRSLLFEREELLFERGNLEEVGAEVMIAAALVG